MRSLAILIPNLLVAAVAASSLFLASCSTTPTDEGQKPAPTEERKPDAGTGAEGSRVAPIDLTKQQGTGLSALKDPNNILSKRSIFYDFDKFDVRDEYRGLVEAHAKYLRDNPGAKMLIQGNTDERGSREYNVGLGQRRSDGVKKLMILLGAKESQIESVSLGEEKPRDAGHGEQSWAQNRRADILYSGEY
jgi:peptidoglycan-associated lipoprotein